MNNPTSATGELEHLGDLLRTLRGERKAKEVADKLGVSFQAVSLWEAVPPSDHRAPSPAHLDALLALYAAPADVQALAWKLRAKTTRGRPRRPRSVTP